MLRRFMCVMMGVSMSVRAVSVTGLGPGVRFVRLNMDVRMIVTRMAVPHRDAGARGSPGIEQ